MQELQFPSSFMAKLDRNLPSLRILVNYSILRLYRHFCPQSIIVPELWCCWDAGIHLVSIIIVIKHRNTDQQSGVHCFDRRLRLVKFEIWAPSNRYRSIRPIRTAIHNSNDIIRSITIDSIRCSLTWLKFLCRLKAVELLLYCYRWRLLSRRMRERHRNDFNLKSPLLGYTLPHY